MSIFEKVKEHATRVHHRPGSFGSHVEYEFNRSMVRMVLLALFAGGLLLLWKFWG